MTTWNIKLKTRNVTLEVKKILQRWTEGPAMKILDQYGNHHKISALEFTPMAEFEKIQEGTKIVLTLYESVGKTRVVPPKRTAAAKKPVAPPEDILPEGDYKWRCLVCGNKGGYDCDGTDDPKIIADHIFEAHWEASGGECPSENLEVFNRDMVIQKELMEFVKLKLVKAK